MSHVKGRKSRVASRGSQIEGRKSTVANGGRRLKFKFQDQKSKVEILGSTDFG